MTDNVKIIAALIVALVIGVGVTILGGTVNKWRNGYIQNQERGQTLKTTSGIIGDNDASAKEGATTDSGVAAARDAYERGYEDAQRHNPDIAARDERPIPVELRNLAHQRRIQRERSGRPLVGGQAEPQAAPAPER